MTLHELVMRHAQLTDEARELMKRKNHDYESADDVFCNFREFGRVGILVRLSDKLARLRAYMEKGEFQVRDEKLRDTVEDALNYLILFEAYEELP